jgi:hypothetical protein
MDARYLGNHVVKQLRVIDFNQIDVSRGGFLTDFLKARNNGFLALNAIRTSPEASRCRSSPTFWRREDC